MYVEHSGWSLEKGAYSYQIFIDEKKTDYEIHFHNGSIAKQAGPFEYVTADWNNDGDVYTEFGASFISDNGKSFWTPVEMVSALIAAREGEKPWGGASVKDIPGINLPGEKHPGLDEQIKRSEQRAMHQEIERNQKMNALGIRGPGEPWAR